MTWREIEKFVLQRGPDEPVEPCRCGSSFATLGLDGAAPYLRCAECATELDAAMVRFWDSPRPCRSPCGGTRRVIVPKVRAEVSSESAKAGAERWDLFCVECREKDGSIPKDTLRGYRTARTRSKNSHQRVDILERAGSRCELCSAAGVALDVGHCLSDADARALNVGPEIAESDWNKCALCVKCNGTEVGYGPRSMSPSTYCNLAHTRAEAKAMVDFGPKGPQPVDPTFYRIFCLLRDRMNARHGGGT